MSIVIIDSDDDDLPREQSIVVIDSDDDTSSVTNTTPFICIEDEPNPLTDILSFPRTHKRKRSMMNRSLQQRTSKPNFKSYRPIPRAYQLSLPSHPQRQQQQPQQPQSQQTNRPSSPPPPPPPPLQSTVVHSTQQSTIDDEEDMVSFINYVQQQNRHTIQQTNQNHVMNIECPVCRLLFAAHTIEQHSSVCDGQVKEGEGKKKKTVAIAVTRDREDRHKKNKGVVEIGPTNYYADSDTLAVDGTGFNNEISGGLSWESAGQTRFG